MKTAVAVMICSSLSAPSAFAADWNGSYSAEGQCFCVGDIPPALRSTIVPTPIGGQAVSQVCQRIGEGPGLRLVNGTFNHPVYSDAQCGNGPQTVEGEAAPADCAGSLDGKGVASASCQGVGPRWNLAKAFSRNRTPAAAKPDEASDTAAAATNVSVQADTGDTSMVDKPVVSSMSVEVVDEASGDKKKLKATVISSQSAANRAPATGASLQPFTGKQITIDGVRYLQARDGLPAYGGAAGSRIILDDEVFLRDDGTINPTDLYRVPPAGKSADPAASVAVEASHEPAQTRTAKSAGTANEARSDKVSDAQKAAAQRQADAAATARQVAAEKKRMQALEAARARAVPDEAVLRLAKERLEAESAEKARTAQQTRAADRQQAALKAAEAGKARASLKSDDVQDAKAARRAPGAGKLTESAERSRSVTETARQVNPTADAAADPAQDGSGVDAGILTALRLPAAVRASSRNFEYLEAMPVSYDVGGNGVMLEGSGSSHSRFHYLGRLGVTGNYQEVMVGGGYYLTPPRADRLTVVLLAGVEHGSFELVDDELPEIAVDYSDSGLYLGAASRFVINNRFELKAGVGYSSFFEGDATLFGGGYYHVTRKLDLVTRFEVGDNDLLGIGVRFYY